MEQLKIVFSNQHAAVVFKPAEQLSVPSRHGATDPRPVTGRLLEAQLGQRVWPCHRLDEDVSGLLLFALNSDCHKAVNSWFELHKIQKLYQALACGEGPLPKVGAEQTWTCRLMRGKKRSYEAAFGKESVTKAVLNLPPQNDIHPSRSVWSLSPLTGRPHQLRYEMTRHGFPIVGDKLYGSTAEFNEPGIALRAVSLNLEACEGREKFGLPNTIALNEKLWFFRNC